MRVVLAGGGTTGHIAPLLATADALTELVPGVSLTCVGTPHGLEKTVVPAAGYDLVFVDPVPLSRTLNVSLLTLPFRLEKAVRQAKTILRERRAEVVVGFGGYASLPVSLAAHRLHIPVVIHEANAVPGIANRIAARFATTTCVTFANTTLPRQVITGLPVRAMIATLDRRSQRPEARARLGFGPDDRVLLVSGGSQGAQALNAVVVAALPGLDARGISVLHVTGPKNVDARDVPPLAHATYRRLGYVERMDDAYAAADLMLARSGAGTVTETAMIGLPTIYVPLPHGNGEQAKNAASVVAAGGGLLIDQADLTPARLVAEAARLIATPGELERMGSAAAHLMPRDAAMRVARAACEAVASCR